MILHECRHCLVIIPAPSLALYETTAAACGLSSIDHRPFAGGRASFDRFPRASHSQRNPRWQSFASLAARPLWGTNTSPLDRLILRIALTCGCDVRIADLESPLEGYRRQIATSSHAILPGAGAGDDETTTSKSSGAREANRIQETSTIETDPSPREEVGRVHVTEIVAPL
jgi:hypothetical protein